MVYDKLLLHQPSASSDCGGRLHPRRGDWCTIDSDARAGYRVRSESEKWIPFIDAQCKWADYMLALKHDRERAMDLGAFDIGY